MNSTSHRDATGGRTAPARGVGRVVRQLPHGPAARSVTSAAAARRAAPSSRSLDRACAPDSVALAARVRPPANIASRHGTLAATNGMNCAQCHSEQLCAGCHAGPDSRQFHAANFVERHAVDVFANTADCASCHNTERFCRDCHNRTGVAADGRMNAAFHTGKLNWVLSHGQAARTGMESCASCHRQNDCVRCHSASGGWGVNPHRSGFQASALAARNAASCRWCHLGGLPVEVTTWAAPCRCPTMRRRPTDVPEGRGGAAAAVAPRAAGVRPQDTLQWRSTLSPVRCRMWTAGRRAERRAVAVQGDRTADSGLAVRASLVQVLMRTADAVWCGTALVPVRRRSWIW